MSPSKKSNLGFAESFILSGTAAAISKTSAAPIERVKLLLQNQNELLKQGKLSAGYNGVKDCVSRTLKHEGLVSFWRGNFASVVRYFPQQALNFGFKDQVIYIPTHCFWRENSNITNFGVFISSSRVYSSYPKMPATQKNSAKISSVVVVQVPYLYVLCNR